MLLNFQEKIQTILKSMTNELIFIKLLDMQKILLKIILDMNMVSMDLTGIMEEIRKMKIFIIKITIIEIRI